MPSWEEVTLNPGELERIVRDLLRQYALPLTLRGISAEAAGRCMIGFADRYSGAPTLVGVWCDAQVSPHQVRESLKRGLDIVD